MGSETKLLVLLPVVDIRRLRHLFSMWQRRLCVSHLWDNNCSGSVAVLAAHGPHPLTQSSLRKQRLATCTCTDTIGDPCGSRPWVDFLDDIGFAK